MVFHCDRNCFVEGLCKYLKENIAGKQLDSYEEDLCKWYLLRNKHTKEEMAYHRCMEISKPKHFLENLLIIFLNISKSMLLLGSFKMTSENQNLQHYTGSLNQENLIHKVKDFPVLQSFSFTVAFLSVKIENPTSKLPL